MFYLKQSWKIFCLILLAVNLMFVFLVVKKCNSFLGGPVDKPKEKCVCGLEKKSINKDSSIHPTRDIRLTPSFITPVSDFVHFPCMPFLLASLDLKEHGHCVRVVNVTRVADHVADYECVKLRVLNDLPICIHDPRADRYISGAISAGRIWEHALVKNLTGILKDDPDMDFIDIGCNIGMYSLAAAQVRRRVFAVDVYVENLRLVAKSTVLGGVENNLTLIWNGLSNKYGTFPLNAGKIYNKGTISLNLNYTGNDAKPSYDYYVETIQLDDLKGIFRNRKVVIKIDVEGHELHVLKGAKSFLEEVNVRFVQLEFFFHRGRDSGYKLVELLRELRFQPRRFCTGDISLDTTPITKWPSDLCFVRV